jgi:superfamily II DNA or RNA helicase/HKD family nuclease/diadenosine tetraphosphate (Ap4A) HIT family hydrolase
MPCPTCDAVAAALASAPLAQNDLAVAWRAPRPAAVGHALLAPRAHRADLFACTAAERAALFDLAAEVKATLDLLLAPRGYALHAEGPGLGGAGPTHALLHLVPRFGAAPTDDVNSEIYAALGDAPQAPLAQVVAGPEASRPEPLVDGAEGGALYDALAPMLPQAHQIDILAAFVQDSGLRFIGPALREALARGAHVRVLTGDYLDITQAHALRRLLDWTAAAEAARAEAPGQLLPPGTLTTRVVEARALGGRSFHPKAWRIEGPRFGVGFVGSSNLSRSALSGGVEWNLRIDRDRDAHAWARVQASYQRLWDTAAVLTADWVEAYARRVAARPAAAPFPGERAPEAPLILPAPTPIQVEALAALQASRAEGRQRALVVMATGLGKTVLAALDLAQLYTAGRPSVLWVAHRRELLEQAAETLRAAFPDARFGWMVAGERPTAGCELLFASVQSLARAAHTMPADHFDAVVIDEVHHAEAPSYRRVLDHFAPRWLLGLTATPERADGGDIPGLFDDNVVFRADLGRGIAEAQLVPFAYFGLCDPETDYRPAWRSGRFDLLALTLAVETEIRMQRLWDAWTAPDKAGTRTLVFCVSIRHAVFVRDWLTARGVHIRLCHAGPGADDRALALRDLESGAIDAICSVDLFNEGVDCKPIDRVVMLRPTESPVLFLQQLGRGLRRAPDKPRLVVIDFVGNHAIFLDRVRTLLALGDGEVGLRSFLTSGEAAMPPGCTLHYELEAIDLLKRLLPAREGKRSSATEALIGAYRELAAARGRRPTAGELVRLGHRLTTLPTGSGGWFGFVAAEGGLDPTEAQVVATSGAFLRAVEAAPSAPCFHLVLIEALVELDGLHAGAPMGLIAARAQRFIQRSPELRADLELIPGLEGTVGRAATPSTDATFEAHLRRVPVAAWCAGDHLRLDGDRLALALPVVDGPTLNELTRELIDARLALRRARRFSGGAPFSATVDWGPAGPVLRRSPASPAGRWPSGTVDAHLPDGAAWRFRFEDDVVQGAHPVGRSQDALPTLLHGWFSPAARSAESAALVHFRPSPDGWWVEPSATPAAPPTARVRLPAFPTLRAAAGWDGRPDADLDAHSVRLPGPMAPDHFALRVSGPSMDGGTAPLRDGDWAVFAPTRGLGLGALDGQVALLAVGAPGEEPAHLIKRVARGPEGLVLRADNPDFGLQPAQDAVAVARLVRAVRPEALAPAPGAALDDPEAAFGLSRAPTGRIDRVDGHLFLCAEGQDLLPAPDRWPLRVPGRQPAETAFLLARPAAGEPWRYLGVARWSDADGAWAWEAPDLALWRSLSTGRASSRTLAAAWQAAARAFVERALALRERALQADPAEGSGLWVRRGAVRGRVEGPSPRGGLRVSGGPEGFAERTISVLDLGWSLAARADVAARGGVLDEARVNRLRYLDGTPKESTRWIDTGWALAVLAVVDGA